MGSEWKKCLLGDIIRTNTTSYSIKENWTYVNYLDTGNITKNVIDDIQYINLNNKKLPSRAKRKIKYNSIIYSTVRPNQCHFGIIKNQPENFLVSTGFTVIDIIEGQADADYIYYWLTQNKVINLLHAIAEQSVSAYPSIKPSDIENLELFLPDLKTQTKIASILKALDNKIELNNAINKNLEEQAQAIYSHYISTYKKTGSIGEYCTVKSGFAFKSSWWSDKGIKVIKIKNIENGTLNLSDCSFVTNDKYSVSSEFSVTGGDLLIAMTGATIGKFAVVPKTDEKLLVNQRVGKFFLGNQPIKKLPFLYCTLKQKAVISDIINKGQGSAQPNISGMDIMATECSLPPKDIIENFNEMMRPTFESIIQNNYENAKLVNLRDTLLPKLMSGEIDVSEIDI